MAELTRVKITKLVHGGQGLGALDDGRKVFVWNSLPGETVNIEITKKRRDYAEALAVAIIEPSKDRIDPKDSAYLSTSPWQIMTFQAENNYKKQILQEAFTREGQEIDVPDMVFDKNQLNYRNKMEYSFWADNEGLHLALFKRASHGKQIVEGSSIAKKEIDEAARKIIDLLNKENIRGSQLKTLVLRVNAAGNVVAALFVKDESFPRIESLISACQGVAVYYSTPKSPASVITKELYRLGSIELSDKLLGVGIKYDVNSFFQVNLPVFELALKRIDYFTGGAKNIIDMYSGVGTIGAVLGGTTTLVEIDDHNIKFAKQNVNHLPIDVVQASTDKALDYITADSTIIFDPPRAGLHSKVVERIIQKKPLQIVYLSCNPSTQARDIGMLKEHYKITKLDGYNFFPRTPHIESLCILSRI